MAAGYVRSEFFVLRAPLLPIGEFLSMSRGLPSLREGRTGGAELSDEEILRRASSVRRRLKELVARPEVREAIFVASPGLHDQIDRWDPDGTGRSPAKVERALVSYLARMAGRATPFGLFAGLSLGKPGERTRLRLAGIGSIVRHTRPDTTWVRRAVEEGAPPGPLPRGLRSRANVAAYRVNGSVRLPHPVAPGKSAFDLLSFEATEALRRVLEKAAVPTAVHELEAMLVRELGVAEEEASQFVKEVFDSGLLVPERAIGATGGEPLDRIGTGMGTGVRERFQRIDREGIGLPPSRYDSLRECFPLKVEMLRPPAAGGLSLPERVVRDTLRGIHALWKLRMGSGDDGLTGFRNRFLERYGEREMPLCEVLDEDAGIGFQRVDHPAVEASPLLEGIPLTPRSRSEALEVDAGRLRILAGVMGAWRPGCEEVDLESTGILSSPPRHALAPLPNAFAAMIRLWARSEEDVERGAYRLALEWVSGPSGTEVLGRFCNASPELTRLVRDHLAAEERLDPNAVHAELAYLPPGRDGNVVVRPPLREHEIVLWGGGGAETRPGSIGVNELLMSLRGDRIVLRSPRIDREILPRLTAAHNPAVGGSTAYRFLHALAFQGVTAGLGWDWGPFRGLPALPRVVLGRVVLARARWNLSKRGIALARGQSLPEQYRRLRKGAATLGIPRVVAMADGDQELLIDLDNVSSAGVLVHSLLAHERTALVEPGCPVDESPVTSNEGSFQHEILLPFLRNRNRAPAPPPSPVARAAIRRSEARRAFPPGSPWVFAKLYAPPRAIDGIVRDFHRKVIRVPGRTDAPPRWHFVRYADPQWHVRLRLLAEGEGGREARARLEPFARRLLREGRAWRFQLDTYDREVERYGGPAAIEIAEKVFHADSEVCLAVLEALRSAGDPAARWVAAAAGVDAMLHGFGLDLRERLLLAERLESAFLAEFEPSPETQRGLSSRFRSERDKIEAAIWGGGGDPAPPFRPILDVVRAGTVRLRPLSDDLSRLDGRGLLGRPTAEILESFIHMRLNRLLVSAHRAHEAVLYAFLRRLYASRLARERQSARGLTPRLRRG